MDAQITLDLTNPNDAAAGAKPVSLPLSMFFGRGAEIRRSTPEEFAMAQAQRVEAELAKKEGRVSRRIDSGTYKPIDNTRSGASVAGGISMAPPSKQAGMVQGTVGMLERSGLAVKDKQPKQDTAKPAAPKKRTARTPSQGRSSRAKSNLLVDGDNGSRSTLG